MTLGQLHKQLLRTIDHKKSLLKAAQDAHKQAEEQIATEANVPSAFVHAVTEHFPPTHKLLRLIKKIDPSVDIRHGQWVHK